VVCARVHSLPQAVFLPGFAVRAVVQDVREGIIFALPETSDTLTTILEHTGDCSESVRIAAYHILASKFFPLEGFRYDGEWLLVGRPSPLGLCLPPIHLLGDPGDFSHSLSPGDQS